MVWATRVTSIAMQMAVPTGLGYLADQRWGLTPWLTIVGACLGGAMFAMEIVRLAQGMETGTSRRSVASRKRRGSRGNPDSRKNRGPADRST